MSLHLAAKIRLISGFGEVSQKGVPKPEFGNEMEGSSVTVETSQSADYIVLTGISWPTYQRILETIGQHHPRHTYDRGTLELRRVLHGIAWDGYQRFLEALGDVRLRHTFDRGTLEMMTPRKDHDWISRLLGRMIDSMALALDVPIQSMGSTTLSAAGAERGLQPDEAYYVAHEPQVRGKETYDPQHDPPPDLVVEVDVTKTSIPRLPVYAAIGVSEIWRYNDRRIEFYRLSADGRYEAIERSVAFPLVAPADVTRFLDLRHTTDEHSVVRAFVAWAEEEASRTGGGD